MDRRTFTKGMAGLVGTGLLTGLYTWQVEPFWLEFVHQPLAIKQLPTALAGKTLMQISDMHVGNRFDYKYLISSLQKAQTFQPDYVVYTGDYISYQDDKQLLQLKEVLGSAVKGRLGTAAILGNHDYGIAWSQQTVADKVIQELSSVGITVLRNEARNFNGLNIIGLDDYWGTNFKPQPVFQNLDHTKAHLVLCHNPDVCDLPIWSDYQGWILAGHTHGGQCKAPFLTPPMLPVKNKKYSAGVIDLEDGRSLYINRALGHLWQVRFNVRPEITVFHLETA